MSDVDSQALLQTDPKIKQQLEFYFLDSNLPKDKFLLTVSKKTPEGWVSLKTISEFKKMRQMDATVSKLGAAAKASDFLAVDDKAENMRRTTALPDTEALLREVVRDGRVDVRAADRVTEQRRREQQQWWTKHSP